MLPLMAASSISAVAAGGAGTAGAVAAPGMLAGMGGLFGGIAESAGPILGAMGASGMFGGGESGEVDNSKAISGGPWYQGDFNVGGGDDITKFAMIGVVILLIIVMAKGK